MHPDPQERERIFERLCEVMSLAEALGARSVITLAGTPQSRPHLRLPSV